VVQVRLRGDDGATAAALALAALATGLGGVDPRLPCPADLGDFAGRAACVDGELTMTSDLRDELVAAPTILTRGVRVVPAMRQGALVGLRVEALSAQDPLSWLGLRNGDILESIDGQSLVSPDQLVARYSALATAATITVEVLRQGRRGVLRFRVR
jgi:membrane-associated protease RseP (regulator of RpoE activity)